jgi:hypothetical protein
MQKIIEGEGLTRTADMPKDSVKSEEEKKKWQPYKYLQKQKGMTKEKEDHILKAMAEIPSGFSAEDTATLKNMEAEAFWQEVARKLTKGEAHSPDEIAFYKAH